MTQRIDVLIVGGGAAGLAAAVQLGRMRRQVVVVDSGQPRNGPAAHMHGYPGLDGIAPSTYLANVRAEARSYGAVIVQSEVETIEGDVASGFTVTTAAGDSIETRMLLIATGITDVLPDIPGVREQWGRGVIACPYCHGWEVRDQRIVVIDSIGMGTHQALLFRLLSGDVTLVLHRGGDLDDEQAARLDACSIPVVRQPIASIDVVDDVVAGVVFDDGTRQACDVVVVGGAFQSNAAAFGGLDVRMVDHMSGFGEVVDTDATGLTSVPGVYAAGNVVDPSQQVVHAAGRGTWTGSMMNMALLHADLDVAVRSRRDSAFWDERYAANPDRIWSGKPNGSLVVEVAGMPAGRALDIGCGEGADAIWLTERGWTVTATDISRTAIDRGREQARAAKVEIDWRCGDVLAVAPERQGYDLVSIQYPALLRSAGDAPIRAIIDAVAPGGTLLFVGHALDPEVHRQHGFNPADYSGLDDFRRLLGDDFTIEVDETRPRPSPPANNPHIDDTVLRAKRR